MKVLLALAACGALGLGTARFSPSMPPAAGGARLAAETAVQQASLYSLGMRRVAADLALIRLIIYYGTREGDDDGHGHGEEGGHHELLPRGMAVLDADPSFTYPALYTAGALAFNLQRPDEAIRMLEYALARDPRNAQLQAYLAAVGFHKKGDRKSVIALLEPMLDYEDCPAMIKHLMAVLYKRERRFDRARALYTELLDHPDYAVVARQELDKLN